MEGCPKTLMISYDTKEAGTADFTDALSSYIREYYQENPENYASEVSQLNQLRKSVITVSRGNQGCSLLRKYFQQLFYLQSRFPMGEGGAASILFTWYDVYSGEPVSIKDILYEQACVLFNLGGLYSQLGANEMRLTEESMKIACTYFQCAAGAFRHLWENFTLDSMSDMNKEIVKLKEIVMLGQAQECLLEKSIKDNKKNVLIARIGMQVKEYFEEAVKLLAGSETAEMGSSVRKSWTKHLQIKILVYTAVSYMYMANESHDSEKFGEEVGFLKVASEKMTEALKLSKGQPDQVLETTKFVMDVVGNKLQGAVKDNEFVYHQAVPAADKLPEIKGAPLVKAMPFTYKDPTITDIFQRLIPMRAHESASLYSEEKAKLLRKMATEVEDKDSTLNEALASMHIEELLNPEEEKLPENLANKLKTFQSEGGGLAKVDDTMKELSDFSSKLKFLMDEIEEQLEEAKEEMKGEEEDRKRNDEFEKHLKDLSQCREAHEKANKTNSEIMKHFETHRPILEFLRRPQEDILASLPSQNVIDAPQDEPVVQRIRELLGAVERMKTQRVQLMTQLREQLNKDDITKELVVRQDGGTEAFFEEQLQKHNDQCAVLRQNMAAQENILASLTEANAKYAPTRQAAQDVTLQRNAKVQSYMGSLTLYDEMLERMRQGLQFYKSLELTLAKLAKRIDDFQGERTKGKAKRIPSPEAAQSRNVPPARPTAAKPLFMMEKPGPKANQRSVNSAGSGDDLPNFGSSSVPVSWNETRGREPPVSGNWQSDLPPRSMSQPSFVVKDSSDSGSMLYGMAGTRGAPYGIAPASMGSREVPMNRMPGPGLVSQGHPSQTMPTQMPLKDSSYSSTVSQPELSWQGVPSSGMPHQGARMPGIRPGIPQPNLPQDSMQNFMLQNQRTGQQPNMPQQGLPQHVVRQQGLPHQGIPQQKLPHQGFPRQGLPHQVIPQHGGPQQGMSQQAVSPQGITHQGQPQQGNFQHGTHQQGLSFRQTDMLSQGMTQHGAQQQGVSQHGLPYQRLPQQGLPPQGFQRSGMNWQGINPPAHPRQGTPQQGSFGPGVSQQGNPGVGIQQHVVHQQGSLPMASAQPSVPPQGMQDKGLLRQEPRSLPPVFDPNQCSLSSTNPSRMESNPSIPHQGFVSHQYTTSAQQGKPRYDGPGGPSMVPPQFSQQQLPLRPASSGQGQILQGPNFAREGGIPQAQMDKKPFESIPPRSGLVQEGASLFGRQLSTERSIPMDAFATQTLKSKTHEGFTANQRLTHQGPLSPPAHYHGNIQNLTPIQQGYRQQGFNQQFPRFQGPSQHGNNQPTIEHMSGFQVGSQTFQHQSGPPGMRPQVSLQRPAEGFSRQLQNQSSIQSGNQGHQPLGLPEPLQPMSSPRMFHASSNQSSTCQRRSSDPLSIQGNPRVECLDKEPLLPGQSHNFRQDDSQSSYQFRGLQYNTSPQVGVPGNVFPPNRQLSDPRSSGSVERVLPSVHGSTVGSISPRLLEPSQSSLISQFSGNNPHIPQHQFAARQLPSNTSNAGVSPDLRGGSSTAHYGDWQRPKNPSDSRPEGIVGGKVADNSYFSAGSPTNTYQDQYGNQRANDLSTGISGQHAVGPETGGHGKSTYRSSGVDRDHSDGVLEPSLQPPLLPVSHTAVSYQELGGHQMISLISSPQGEGPRPKSREACETMSDSPGQVASQRKPVGYSQYATREDSMSTVLNNELRSPSPAQDLGKQQLLRVQSSDPRLPSSMDPCDHQSPLEFSPDHAAQPSAPLGPGPPPNAPSTSYYAVRFQPAGHRFQNQFSQLSSSLQNPITLSTGPLMSATLDPVVSAILRQNRQVNVTLPSPTPTSSSASMDLSQYNFQQFQFQQVLLQQQQLIALLQTQQSQHTQQINIETHQIEKLQAQIEDQQKLIQRLVASQHYPNESDRLVITSSNSNELRISTNSVYGENGAQVDHNYSSQGACLGDDCKSEPKRDQTFVSSAPLVNDISEPKRCIVSTNKGATSPVATPVQSSSDVKSRANSKALEAEILADFEALDLIVGEPGEGIALPVDEQKAVTVSGGSDVASKTSTVVAASTSSAVSAIVTSTTGTSVLADVPFYEPMLDKEHNDRLRQSAGHTDVQNSTDLTVNRETGDTESNEELKRKTQPQERSKEGTRDSTTRKGKTENEEGSTTTGVENVERKGQGKSGIKGRQPEKSNHTELSTEGDSELDKDKTRDEIEVSDVPKLTDTSPGQVSIPEMQKSGPLPPPFSRQLGRESFIVLDDKNEAWIKYLKKLDQAVESLHSTCMELCRKVPGTTVDGFAQMWNDLGQVEELDSCSYTCEAGTININKNRYRDILPWDHSRVKLESQENDYINASHIENLTPFSPSYIATQGPIPQCFEDFWTMVWEQQCTVIAMLTSEVEGSKLKCHPYWPREMDTTVNYGNMAVCITNQEFYPQWKNRILLLTDLKSEETRIVRHLQFTAWPDYGVPTTPYDILAFVEEVYRASRKCDATMKNTIVTHCSAGVGRTGTFCCIYSAIAEINGGNGLIDIPGVVRKLRQCRSHMVQRKEQLVFCYQAILCYAQQFLAGEQLKRDREEVNDDGDDDTFGKMPTNPSEVEDSCDSMLTADAKADASTGKKKEEQSHLDQEESVVAEKERAKSTSSPSESSLSLNSTVEERAPAISSGLSAVEGESRSQNQESLLSLDIIDSNESPLASNISECAVRNELSTSDLVLIDVTGEQPMESQRTDSNNENDREENKNVAGYSEEPNLEQSELKTSHHQLNGHDLTISVEKIPVSVDNAVDFEDISPTDLEKAETHHKFKISSGIFSTTKSPPLSPTQSVRDESADDTSQESGDRTESPDSRQDLGQQ